MHVIQRKHHRLFALSLTGAGLAAAVITTLIMQHKQ